MPDETSMFDRAMPVLASRDISASLDFFHKLEFEMELYTQVPHQPCNYKERKCNQSKYKY